MAMKATLLAVTAIAAGLAIAAKSAAENFAKAIRFEKDPTKKNAIMNALFASGQTGD